MPNKQNIRDFVQKQLQKRFQEQADYRKSASRRIWDRLLESSYRNEIESAIQSGRFMSYLDFGHEVQTVSFLLHFFDIPAVNRSLIVPFCDETIIPVRITTLSECVRGKFGILAPHDLLQEDESRRVSPLEIDVMLVPGLAFDEQKFRLGRGHGFYDRFIAECRPDVRTISLAFDCQIVDSVPRENHDLPVSLIVTESRLF
ncbi:MAG: 5-formyltetrahydrofolate cyclo-ligase [Thermoguttaceae bacterium]